MGKLLCVMCCCYADFQQVLHIHYPMSVVMIFYGAHDIINVPTQPGHPFVHSDNGSGYDHLRPSVL